jgi:hypothetical protein
VGAGVRTHSYNHFVTGGLEGGLYRNDWRVSARVETVQALRNNRAAEATPTGLFQNNQSWLATALQVGYRFNRFTGLVASVRGNWWGENVTTAPTFGLGVYFRWD